MQSQGRYFALLMFLAPIVFWGCESSKVENEIVLSRPELRSELLQRLKKDQAVRLNIIESGGHPAYRIQCRRLDENNTNWMKGLVAEFGWPDQSMVGKDGQAAAFMLVQHSIDLEFQKDVLPAIRRAWSEGELPGECYAMLADRVRCRSGQNQLFGTQAFVEGDSIRLQPVDEPHRLDERRAEMGMVSIAEYKEILHSHYSSPKATESDGAF